MNVLPPPSTAAFPRTRVTLIGELASADEATRARAAETLAAVYWHPIHAHLRYRWRLGAEDAEDLTQDFLARAFARDVFARYDPAQARFRTFVRICVDRFMQNVLRSGARVKRGGRVTLISLADREGDEGGAVADDLTTEDEYEARFHQEWVRSLFTLTVRALEVDCRQRGKMVQYQLFEAYDLYDRAPGTRPTYAALAQAHDLPITQVTNHLAAARRRFREIAMETLSALCASDAEYRAEARALLGIEVA
jgi:DNA-directed RNA polymerase specialized sigma24 family protein